MQWQDCWYFPFNSLAPYNRWKWLCKSLHKQSSIQLHEKMRTEFLSNICKGARTVRNEVGCQVQKKDDDVYLICPFLQITVRRYGTTKISTYLFIYVDQAWWNLVARRHWEAQPHGLTRTVIWVLLILHPEYYRPKSCQFQPERVIYPSKGRRALHLSKVKK